MIPVLYPPNATESRSPQLKIPVYPYPASYAREHDELEQYRASHRANIDCQRAIENAIAENYEDNILSDRAAQQVVELFGFDRTMFVLANTVREKGHDSRISRDNKEWAKTIPVFEDESGGRNRRLDYVMDRSYPGLVDIFVRQVRRTFQLTQPLTSLEIANEAHRICEKLQSLREPNNPSKTHFMVQLSPDFMLRASTMEFHHAGLQAQIPGLSRFLERGSEAQRSALHLPSALRCAAADEMRAHSRALNGQMAAAQKRLEEIDVLQRHILNYVHTREAFQQYKASGYSKKFLAEYRQEIEMHRTSKRTFNELGLKKLPSKKTLDAEYGQVLAAKKSLYAAYHFLHSGFPHIVQCSALS